MANIQKKSHMKNQHVTFTAILFALTCFGLLPTPKSFAVLPPPDGGYPGGNTAEGQNALFNLTTGRFNTAVGFYSLASDTAVSFNTAVGAGALLAAAANADQNTAIGAGALLKNTGGSQNTGVGAFALVDNTGGILNTAIGHEALFHNTTGYLNTAVGDSAGINVTTASNVTCIGATAFGSNVSDTTWIGSVYGATTQSGTTASVIVSDQGQLGTLASAERFKKDIATMEKASEAILSLRPVTFHYKTDTKGVPQFGLIAEEVAKVNPALVLPDKEGRPYTVRYDAVNAMLLNEFLKEHRRVEELESTVAKQEAAIAEQHRSFQRKLTQQETQIEALTLGLQKVSAQMETMKPATQIVVNEP
jgi:uncharacterized coiled-coil protein SlyX